MRSTYEPADAAELFRGLEVPWWVAGGWALDLWLGASVRIHEDLDLAVLRPDQRAVLGRLAGWDLRLATAPDVLRPLRPDEEVGSPPHAIWCRPPEAEDWAFELLLNDAEGSDWLFRRDHGVRAPLETVGGRTASGIPFLHPEFVLLFKAKHVRERDVEDFERVLPRLEPNRRRWLAGAIERVHPAHPWIAALDP